MYLLEGFYDVESKVNEDIFIYFLLGEKWVLEVDDFWNKNVLWKRNLEFLCDYEML